MKKFALVILMLAVMALMLVPSFSFAADDAAKVFDTKCAVCHGKDGAGKLKGTPDFRSAEVQKLSDQQLFDIVAKGKNGKESHAFSKKGVDDKTIKELVSYIRSLKK